MPVNEINTVSHLITDEGIAVVLLACMVFLGFIYFWKMINRKTTQEKNCEIHDRKLDDVMKKLQQVREDLIEIRALMTGTFRNTGGKQDED